MELQRTYKIKVYVDHGYYQYEVEGKSSALEHAHIITASGVYRRVNSSGDVEFFQIKKVKVCGDGLDDTAYSDEFMRT